MLWAGLSGWQRPETRAGHQEDILTVMQSFSSGSFLAYSSVEWTHYFAENKILSVDHHLTSKACIFGKVAESATLDFGGTQNRTKTGKA